MKTNSKPVYVFANWKMYLDAAESVVLAKALAKQSKKLSPDVVTAVFPSALSLAAVVEELKKTPVSVGAQNVYWVEKGGYTGEVSAAMVKAVGAEYALVGHSERRHVFHETNHDVRAKLEAVLAAGLVPVLCVGETLKEKESGVTEEVLEAQLRAAYTNLAWPKKIPLIVAYEPVWAISKGTDKIGLPCSPQEAEAEHARIVTFMKALQPEVEAAVIFGGSVRDTTMAGYLRQEHVQGVLVGAASTHLESWNALLTIAST